MTCPCDLPGPGGARHIAPGLSRLPHSPHDFNSLRAAMLSSIRDFSALDDWNARAEDDLGVMLLEFMAYAGHSVAFYSWAAANESYLGTAWRDETVAGLVSLIGYAPRPGAPASAELAAIVTGRRPITVPAGAQFRSAAFDDEAPQVCEALTDTGLHPAANRWTIRAPRRVTLSDALYDLDTLDVDPYRARLEPDDIVVIRIGGAVHAAFTVLDVTDAAQVDGTRVKRVQVDRALNIPALTPVADIEVLVPSGGATLYADPDGGGGGKGAGFTPQAGSKDLSMIDKGETGKMEAEFLSIEAEAEKEFGALGALEEVAISYLPIFSLTLDRPRNDFKSGQPLVVAVEDDLRWFTLSAVTRVNLTVKPASSVSVTIEVEPDKPVTSSVTVPAVTTPVTQLTLDADLNDASRKLPGTPHRVPWQNPLDFVIHTGFVRAARVAAPPVMEVWPTDPLDLQPGADRRVRMPPDPGKTRRFLLQDVGGLGYAVDGSLDEGAGQFVFEDAETWAAPLVPPITLFGNVVGVRRGETIVAEEIGQSVAGIGGQTFPLAKSPKAFLPDLTGETERGYRSTMALRVGGALWDEVEDLVVAGPADEVFMLRQTPAGDTEVVTGDGAYGRRVPPGQALQATYVHGAGAAAPPAEALNQIATPVDGLSSVTNPVEASGGADPETGETVRDNGPAVAMLLGRIVSLADVLAVARGFPGVTAARADWLWQADRQAAAIAVVCIATDAVCEALAVKIANLSEPGLVVSVTPAVPVPLRLSVTLETDPRLDKTVVEDAVRAHLMAAGEGPLDPARIGIGEALFRSVLFAEILSVKGAEAVPALTHDDMAFSDIGLTPGAGAYFDVAAGGLVINGREEFSDGQ